MTNDLLDATELERIEAEHAEGLSTRQVIELFQPLGVRLSEATFRKYVQIGLLPGCTRRVGRKGKHKGSQGLYPVTVVRRINLIKKMMDEGLTLEEIRGSFLAFRNDIDSLQDALETLFKDFASQLEGRELAASDRRVLRKEFRQTRITATSLVRRLEKLGSAIAARPLPGLGQTG